MKIAHINMFYLPTIGGVEQVMYELAKRQVAQGHEVHVFCCDSDKEKRLRKKEEIIEGVHVHRLRYWFRLSLSTFIWPSLLWKLRKYKFDIIHTHVSGHAYILFAGLIARLKKTPHVHTTHCPWTDAFRPLAVRVPLFFTYLFLNRWSFGLCDRVIALTPWEIETLKKWTSERKIRIVPNGMPEYFFKKIKNNDFKERLEIKDKMVLFFGRFNITKGPDKLAIAAKEILKERDDISFVFVGPDEGVKNKVRKIVEGEGKIKVLDPIRGWERVKVYQAADVFVLPSYREGLPLTLFEAMASELPIVASSVNGVPYEMEDPANGFFVQYGDINGLKEKILRFLDDKALAKKVSKNNKEKAKKYDWDLIAEMYMKIYKELSDA